MSELDKYSRHDPLARHSNRPKNAALTIADTDAWLAKNGNGMDRIKTKAKAGAVNIWGQYSKVNTEILIHRHLNVHGEIVPSDIQDASCRRSVLNKCKRMTNDGVLVEFKEKRLVHHTNLNNNQKYLISGFKRA